MLREELRDARHNTLSNESLKDPGKGLKHMYITYLMAVGSFT